MSRLRKLILNIFKNGKTNNIGHVVLGDMKTNIFVTNLFKINIFIDSVQLHD
jgi:hypothetical protein